MISVFLPEHPTLCDPRKREVSSPFFHVGAPWGLLVYSLIYSHTGGDGASSLTPAIKYTYTRILWVACELKSLSTIHIKKYIKYTTRKNYDLQIKETNIHNLKYKYMKAKRIGLITVFDAILTGRQAGVKLQCLYENPMSNNFRKTSVLKKLWNVN